MADFDADGHLDLITGCFEGGSYLMRGKAGRAFEQPEPVLDRTGKPLRVGQYYDKGWIENDKDLGIAATPVDWDGDGDLDLLLGSSEGRFWLSRNVGTAKKASFAEELLLLEGPERPLEVTGNHAMPVVADWDGDGAWDLLSGTSAGGVVWFRNIGKPGAPAFAAEQTLVPHADGKWESPGQRTQVAVADFDDDGDLDLLVGDYRSRQHPEDAKKREFHGYVWLYRRQPAAAPGTAERASAGERDR